MTTHLLKSWPEFYDAIAAGAGTFDVRKNDRDFQPGDVVVLRKYDRKSGQFFPNETLRRKIIAIQLGGGFGIESGYAVLGLAPETEGPRA